MEPVLDLSPNVVLDDALAGGEEGTLAADVRAGLTRPLKELPPKHLYDAHGSALFERICELPEYYPTRAEREILAAAAPEMARATGAVELVELGAGSAAKTRLLLDALAAEGGLRRYVAVDVSAAALRASAEALAAEYPGLAVHGLAGDFERHLDRLPAPLGPRLLCFLGGTIGNLLPAERAGLLGELARAMAPQDAFLLGADLVKDADVLVAAYDDAAGVTAEFNRNVLRVVNRELGADFAPEAFAHVALWDPAHEWVEMRLRARQAQVVRIAALDLEVRFAAGEDLRTEISAKFTQERLVGELRAAGLEPVLWRTDRDGRFAVTLARPAGCPA